MTVEFLVTTLVVVATPGAGVIYTVTAGLSRGRRASMIAIVSGVLINILNPKLTIFFFAFLLQFVSISEPHAIGRMLQLSAVFMLATLIVFCIYGLFAATARHHVVSRPRVIIWVRRAFAGSFVTLGARLALTPR